MKTERIILFLFMCLMMSAGCGNNKEEEKQKQPVTHDVKTEPVAVAPVTLTVEELEGMKLFMRNCNKCHPGG